jgi:hypothetical protein
MTSASLTRNGIAPRPHPIRALAVEAVDQQDDLAWVNDVRQFLVGWLAGLVFFGTFLA